MSSISKTLWASVFLLVCLLVNFSEAQAPEPTATCMQHQSCIRDPGQNETNTKCPSATETYNPVLVNWNNVTGFGMTKNISDFSKKDFNGICPFIDSDIPLCCTDDQVQIMKVNFAQIDSVFGQDVPLCGLNLKKLWCDYTCSPKQNSFVFGLGYKEVMLDVMTNMTEINFHVNEDMACSLFTSCKEVGLIAQASIESSIAFLDFMGVNGQNQSLSIITFEQHSNDEQSLKMSPEAFASRCQLRQDKTAHFQDELLNSYGVRIDSSAAVEQVQHEKENKMKMAAFNDPPPTPKLVPLNEKMHDCGMVLPNPPTVDKYENVKNTTCTFCQELCKAPTIDTTIHFFDGMNSETVNITYWVITGLTVIFQIYNCFIRKPKIDKEYDELQNDVQNNENLYHDINKTASTREVNLFKNNKS